VLGGEVPAKHNVGILLALDLPVKEGNREGRREDRNEMTISWEGGREGGREDERGGVP